MLNGLNKNRLNNALPPLHYVWCKICHQANVHLWWNCLNVRCNICNQAHSTFTCTYITTFANDEEIPNILGHNATMLKD